MIRAEQFSEAIGEWRTALPHPRMRVYRNNVAGGLVNALKVRFPVTEQIVGGEFFAAMAMAYADGNRPASPMLIAYGATLPAFIRDFPPAASVPYLADVAQLENLWWTAYHAADATPLMASALAGLAPEALGEVRFRIHPSAGLTQSDYAAGSIWHAHNGGMAMSLIATSAGQCVLVVRPHSEVDIRIIPPASFTFLSALQSGETLADAAERAFDCDSHFDIGRELIELFMLGITTGFYS